MTKPHYRRRADGSTVQLRDGLQNVMANLGTSRDKAAHTTYLVRPLSDADLLAAYRSSWLPRKIVDIIPMDATRRWRTWSADKEQITAIEAEERRLGLRHKLRKAMTSARLFGGAALYVGTGEADVSQPLVPDRIKRGGVRHLTVLTKRKLTPGQISEDAESAYFGLPAYYEMQLANGQALRIHPSRLVILQGADLPDGYDDLNSGWGDSVLQAVLETVKQADGTAANAASLVYEANVDVLHIPQLREMLLAPGGDEDVLRYLTTIALGKGNNGMLVLDGGAPTPDGKRDEGTRYERKGASFAGLGDIWDRFMQAVSGAADIPATRLLGMTPSGLNSTGESDLRNYYDRVQAMQEMELSPAMAVLDECLIRAATGGRDAAIYSEWRSLWQTTDKERADLGATTAGIVATLKGADLFPVETLQAAAANAMIETGALPGLEAAIDDHGLDLTEAEGAQEADDPLMLLAGGKPGQPGTTFRH